MFVGNLINAILPEPILNKERADYKNPLDRWAMFLKGWDDMELLERLTEEDPAIAQAKKVLEKMGSDPRAKEIYEQRLKAIMDRNSELYEAVLKGKAEGKAEGKREGRLETARAALQKGLGAELVVEITGLSLTTVEKLKQEIADG